MSKKRKTRQEKIILQLKRELAQKKPKRVLKRPEAKPSQGAISKAVKTKSLPQSQIKKTSTPLLSDDLHLIKKDLVKTSLLALVILSLEFVLYLRLR